MVQRPRRNRSSENIRQMVAEYHLRPSSLVLPLFLTTADSEKTAIPSLPGQFRLGEQELLETVERCMGKGLRSFILFPVIEEHHKSATADFAWDDRNFYLDRAALLKARFPEATIISDVAMDPYSSDGHDGLVQNGQILNDKTLPILGKMAVAQAQAGFDILGPSDMMDGRVGYIRKMLDAEGFTGTGIMSYTAKYASALYGPFRDALDSAPKAGDKKTYQMDPSNAREAIREAQLDMQEGADFLMVKPALHYLDIILRLKQASEIPVAAYHVSGECAMLQAACERGWLQFDKAMPETLLSIHRAGADIILTYFAENFADWYRETNG